MVSNKRPLDWKETELSLLSQPNPKTSKVKYNWTPKRDSKQGLPTSVLNKTHVPPKHRSQTVKKLRNIVKLKKIKRLIENKYSTCSACWQKSSTVITQAKFRKDKIRRKQRKMAKLKKMKLIRSRSDLLPETTSTKLSQNFYSKIYGITNRGSFICAGIQARAKRQA